MLDYQEDSSTNGDQLETETSLYLSSDKQNLLEPQNLSSQNQTDYQAFQEFLQRRVAHNLLSSSTAASHFRHFRILLHDAELLHATDLAWPMELDGLFADAKWIADWLMSLENRSTSTKDEVLARSTVKKYLISIRQIWLFLQGQGRATKTYYTELKEKFNLQDNVLFLPGRSAQIIETLSEAEEAAVFAAIERYSSNPVLKQRDIALFVTALQTTMRMKSLNSMRLENFKQLEPGVWVCQVQINRSSKKAFFSVDKLGGDLAEWQDWYISLDARAVINTYLELTGRTWQSKGPVWLGQNGQPLTLRAQEGLIRNWLKRAGCNFVRPHVLRHTGVDRLINKFNLPIPVVQAISQHADPCLLLKLYARRTRGDVFRDLNQIFPAEKGDTVEHQKLLFSISSELNEISAYIGQRNQNEKVFSQKYVEELLGKQLIRLAKILGYETITESVFLSKDDYLKIETALQSLGLSTRQLLGYEPELQEQTLIKNTTRPG